MLKVVSAAASMKGSLSAAESSECIRKGVLESVEFFNSLHKTKIEVDFISRPIADGGDDTLESIATTKYEIRAFDPHLKEIKSVYGSRGETAIIEMSKASGIALISPDSLDPFTTTTYGTGQLIKDAISKGFKNLLITIGGSATVDGGIGALAALGVRFYDKEGNLIEPFGNRAAGMVHKIDASAISGLKNTLKIMIACDVDNTLTGPTGSAAVFGPQKTSPIVRSNPSLLSQVVRQMDENLAIFNQAIVKESGIDCSELPGSGAAGGFSIGFCSLLGATLEKGSDLVLRLLEYEKLKGSDLVFTNEGFCDSQTLMGKSPYAVSKLLHDSYVVVLTGGVESYEVEKNMLQSGVSKISVLADRPMKLEESIQNVSNLITRAAFRETFAFLSSRTTVR